MTIEKPAIYTIGVYGSTEESFFGALVKHEIELFIDIRARRGMRGSTYKYANSSYLQAKLKDLGIFYAHLKELAPTKEIRLLQQRADALHKSSKRERTELSKAYIKTYKRDILKAYKRNPENRIFAEGMLAIARQLSTFPPADPLRHAVLFCVEQRPQACHRSLVAEDWKHQLGIKIEHLKA